MICSLLTIPWYTFLEQKYLSTGDALSVFKVSSTRRVSTLCIWALTYLYLLYIYKLECMFCDTQPLQVFRWLSFSPNKFSWDTSPANHIIWLGWKKICLLGFPRPQTFPLSSPVELQRVPSLPHKSSWGLLENEPLLLNWLFVWKSYKKTND